MRNKVKLLLLVCLSVRGEEKELFKDKDFLNPAHPTWWMVVKAPDLPLGRTTGRFGFASNSSRSQPSWRTPFLWTRWSGNVDDAAAAAAAAAVDGGVEVVDDVVGVAADDDGGVQGLGEALGARLARADPLSRRNTHSAMQ